MSRLFFSSLLLLSMQVNATEFAGTLTDSLPKSLSRSDHKRISRDQKTGAIVLLSVGGATMIVGGIGYFSASMEGIGAMIGAKNNYSESKVQAYSTTFFVGGIMMLASIPLFIASKNNRRLGRYGPDVSFKMEKNNNFPITGVGDEKFPAVKVGLRF